MKHIIELKVAVVGYDTAFEAEKDLREHIANMRGGCKAGVLESRPDPDEIPPTALVCAEFGYKACEKGQNIQMMLSELNRAWKGL